MSVYLDYDPADDIEEVIVNRKEVRAVVVSLVEDFPRFPLDVIMMMAERIVGEEPREIFDRELDEWRDAISPEFHTPSMI